MEGKRFIDKARMPLVVALLVGQLACTSDRNTPGPVKLDASNTCGAAPIEAFADDVPKEGALIPLDPNTSRYLVSVMEGRNEDVDNWPRAEFAVQRSVVEVGFEHRNDRPIEVYDALVVFEDPDSPGVEFPLSESDADKDRLCEVSMPEDKLTLAADASTIIAQGLAKSWDQRLPG